MTIENARNLIEILSGDSRNAMHSILGFLELIGEGELDPAQRENMRSCRAAADQHFRGVEDVRAILSSVSAEKPVIVDFAPANLFAQVGEVIGILAEHKGVSLFCDAQTGVPRVVAADLDRIGQMLLRITEAAIGAVQKGEVRLNLSCRMEAAKTNLIFEILLPGNVLSPVLIRALQHDNVEFDASLPDSGILGLAAARHLAMNLGGRVDALADVENGTRIAVSIPVEIPMGAATLAEAEEIRSLDAPWPLRILIAEDSEDSFRLFLAYLKGQNHVVVHALNGAEAVELANTGSFDLLFMDIRMPVMDGYAATRRIRELETGTDRPRLPIVVLSAEDLRVQRRRGALAGCSGHLSKPLRKQELLEAIAVYSMPPISARLS